ncbi:MAG: hypothetical protein Q9187_006087, partial [Circinaria calcarea]
MPTLYFDIKTVKSMFDINVWGMIHVTQAFVPLMNAAKGTIANVSSIGTAVPSPGLERSQRTPDDMFTQARKQP